MLMFGSENPFEGFGYKFEYVLTLRYCEWNVITVPDWNEVVVESSFCTT